MPTSISRRNFVKTAALGVAAAGAAGACASGALATEGSHTFADTIAWDSEYDVVVLGIGFSGMASAMTAADEGASVLICEKLKDGFAGGNSRVCAQLFLWGNDDAEATKAYMTDLNGTREVPEDVVDAYAQGIASLGTTLSETFGMDASEFVDVANMGYGCMSPEYPEFEGSDKVHLYATHEGAFDSYLYQSMRERLAQLYADKVDVWFESPATHLIQDPQSKAIIGVQVQRGGETRNVRAINGVVLATGGFEGDQEMVKNYLNLVNYVCAGGTDNTGDGIRMAQEVGANLWHMDSYCGLGGFGAVSFVVDDGAPAARIHDFDLGAINTGASILVGKDGGRWVNESYVPRHGKFPTTNGQWLNPEFPDGIFAVFDETQKKAINDAGDIPDAYADQVIECADVAAAAKAIGCDEDALQETIDDFDTFVDAGKDYQCGRDVSTMRAFEGDKLYVIPLKPVMLNTQGGPERSAAAEVIDVQGDPIPHLYSAGECGGVNAFQYAGGGNVAECFVFGRIAGKNAAAKKDALPEYKSAEFVESSPKKLGDETDLKA
ncbi:MAG: FAD-dependent oxidoreductase [Coriobacteriales bacterium]|jgi:succinate dehydrogenase/fumarate reductase flavoprotein subunit